MGNGHLHQPARCLRHVPGQVIVSKEPTAPGGPDDGHEDQLFRLLDILVWGSVALIFILAVEWFIGATTRTSIARGWVKLAATAKTGQPGE